MKKKALLQYVHHVHYVVQNRDAMVEYLEKNFGMKPERLAEYKNGMKDAMYKVGKTYIEISEPQDPTHPIAKQLAQHGPGIFHVAWGVDNIEEAAKEHAAKGNKMIGMNKIAGKIGVNESPRGYLTSNVDLGGLWFQLAEGEAVH